ncbi:MAG: hypothetical protein QGH51_03665 [Planctomycetota bacterium]|nr:hypothetical protein [Planctomycetota bacterium]
MNDWGSVQHKSKGSALIMVILALALMMSLGIPYLMTSKLRSAAAREAWARAEAREVATSASTVAVFMEAETHPALDPTPLWDDSTEWDPNQGGPLPAALGDVWKGWRQTWGLEVEDLQGRISLATASPGLIQNILRPCFVTSDTDFMSLELPVTTTDGFPDAGVLFMNGNWLEYSGRTSRSFTGLSGVPEDEMPDDTSQTRFREGTVVIDPRIWNLAFARLKDGLFSPPEMLDDLFEADILGVGTLPESDRHMLSRTCSLRTSRMGQAPFGPAVWLARDINPDNPEYAAVTDSSGFSTASLVRFEPEEGEPLDMYALSATTGGWIHLAAGLPSGLMPLSTRVRCLLREPVNINSASPEVLKALVAGLRWRTRPSLPTYDDDLPSGNWRRDWVHPSQAVLFASRVIAARPLTGAADLWARVLAPMAEEAELSDWEAWAIHQNGLDPDQGDLLHTTAPFEYRSGNRFLQRANGALRSRLGSTLARVSYRESVRAAPAGPLLQMFRTQAEFEVATQWSRDLVGMRTTPNNTGSFGGAHEPRTGLALRVGAKRNTGIVMPSIEAETSGVIPVLARESETGPGYAIGAFEHFDFEPSPFGWDLGARGPRTDDLFEWGLYGEGQTASRVEPLSLEAWFRLDAGSADGTLMDLAGPFTESQRVEASLLAGALEVRAWDNAGEDPADPDNMEEALTVRLDPSLYSISDRWFHLGLLLRAVSPRGVQVAVDGVPRGEVDGLTWTTSAIPGYAPGSPDDVIPVESTEGFPARGVLKIGDEILEYSSKTATSFITTRISGPTDYIGGRVARESDDISAGVVDSDHPSGSAVERYGYSSFLASDIPTGGGTLSGGIGPFSVASGVDGPDTITVTTLGGFTVDIGTGISADYLGEIILEPIVESDPFYLEAFQEDGGYAAIFQVRTGWLDQDGNNQGGLEIVRYSSRTETGINIIERDVQSPGVLRAPANAFNNGSFVFEWDDNISNQAGEQLLTLPFWQCYIMPISIKGSGVSDLSYSWTDDEHSEFVQLYTPGDSSLTEWVRYDSILNGCLVRDDYGAISAAVGTYLVENSLPIPEDPNSPGGGFKPHLQEPANDVFVRKIGEPVEDRDIMIEEILRAFQFRGVMNTYDHAQVQGTRLVPVFRTLRALDTGEGYPGRLDRVAIMQPDTAGLSTPPWYTIEWACAVPFQDARLFSVGSTYVAFQETPGLPYLATDLSSLDPEAGDWDPRMIARICKFPSGERPLELQSLSLGGSVLGGGALSGFMDEVFVHSAGGLGSPNLPTARGSFVLSADLPEGASDSFELHLYALTVDNHRVWAPTSGLFLDMLPESGLLDIDGERIAYMSRDSSTGLFQIAPNGRGLHGTQERGHAAGTSVWLVDSRPFTVLVNDVGPADSVFPVEDSASMAARPLLLVGDELVHTPLRSPDGALAMPQRRPPKDDASSSLSDGGEGLLRGRFGTLPAAHAVGTPVYSMPHRFEDRWIEHSDSPAGAWAEFSFDEPNAFWRGIQWQADIPDSSIRLHVRARAGSAEWGDIPEETRGLLNLDEPPGPDGLIPLGLHSDRLDVRFSFDWGAGAFDPVDFLSIGWLQMPVLEEVILDYFAEPRIELREEIRE